MKKNFLVASVFMLSACSTYMPELYKVSQETTAAFQKAGLGNIAVDTLGTDNIDDDYACPSSSESISLPNNMRLENYIRKALIQELMAAGMYDNQAPKITLSVEIKELEYFLSMNSLKTVWDIELKIRSSNGESLRTSMHYQFDAGAYGKWDCKKIAKAYMPAVQAAIFELASSPNLPALLTPKKAEIEPSTTP